MTSTDQIRAGLEEAAAQLRADLARVEQAIAALGGGKATRGVRPKRKKGESQRALRQYVASHPNATRSDLIAALRLTPARVSQLIKQLTDDGVIERAERGKYRLAKAEPATPAKKTQDKPAPKRAQSKSADKQ